MRHAADFYAQAPPEPLQHICDDRAPPVCVINEETQSHTCVSISFLSGIPASHTSSILIYYLDRKCIVLPARCGAGSCSIFPCSTRPLILQPSSFQAALFPLNISRCQSSEAKEKENPPGAFHSSDNQGTACKSQQR